MTPKPTEPTIDELHSNPCIKCYACDFSKDSKCYKGSYKQCSVCAVIQNTIDKCQALISDQVAKARIDELNRTPRINYGNDFAIHINAYLDDRIATLNGVKNK